MRVEKEGTQERNRQKLLSQENLSLTDAAALFGVSCPTLYKLLEDRKVELLRISKRTIRVRKSDLSKLYQNTPQKPTFITKSVAEINKIVEEYISVEDALQQFKISNTWFYNKVRSKKITPIIIKGKAHYPIQPLQKIFAKKEYAEVVEWCTVKELMSIYNVTEKYVYGFASRNALPRKREGGITQISRFHWDKAQGNDPTERGQYYTVPEITEKYKMHRNRVYDIILRHKIPKIQHGRFVMISREHFDNIMNNRDLQ